MRAAIYARYSSAGQRETSIEDQLRDCRAYCQKRNYEIVATYCDKAMTGTNDRRPEFQRMIYESGRGAFDVVVVWKMDRFSRNRYDNAVYRAKLQKNGVKLESAMETIPEGAEGIVLDSVLAGFAEYYSAALSENVKRGLYGSALKHQTLGQHFFGLRPSADNTWEPDPDTAPIVAEIFSRYAAGEATIDIIADLNERGYRTWTGQKLKKDFLRRIIRNEKYKGLYRYQDICDSCIEPIVSEELWEAANKMADRHRESPAAKKEEGGFLLYGKCFCGLCGKPMTSYAGTSATGKVYNYYHCTCGKKNEKKTELEDMVVETVAEAVLTPENIEQYITAFLQWQDAQPSAVAVISQKLAEVSQKISNIVRVIESGIASDALIERLNALEAEKKELQSDQGKAALKEQRFTREDLLQFFEGVKNRDINDIGFRIYLIDTFLIAVFVNYDSLTVQLNIGGGGSPNLEISKKFKNGCSSSARPYKFEQAFLIGCAWICREKSPRH